MKRRVRVWGILLLMLAGMLVAPAPGWTQTTGRPPELQMHFGRAETAWKSGASLLEAKARLDRILHQLPNDVEARMLRVEVLLDMNRTEEAFMDARRAVRLAPTSGRAYLLLTEAARRSGKSDLARRALEQAARYLRESAARHVRLSWNAALLGELALAESLARTALTLDASEPPAYYQLARSLLQQGRPDEAAAVLARGLREDLLVPTFIRQDSLLRRLSGHPALQAFMDGRGS